MPQFCKSTPRMGLAGTYEEMSYSFNSLMGLYIEILGGSIMGLLKGDARTLVI